MFHPALLIAVGAAVVWIVSKTTTEKGTDNEGQPGQDASDRPGRDPDHEPGRVRRRADRQGVVIHANNVIVDKQGTVTTEERLTDETDPDKRGTDAVGTSSPGDDIRREPGAADPIDDQGELTDQADETAKAVATDDTDTLEN